MNSKGTKIRQLFQSVALAVLMVLTHPALAEENGNHCDDVATMVVWEKLLPTNPRDPVVIRLDVWTPEAVRHAR